MKHCRLDYAVEPALGDQIDGMDAEGSGEQPVAGRRGAAALGMAEDRDPGLSFSRLGDAVAEIVSDPAEMAFAARDGDGVTVDGLDGLGHGDQHEVAAAFPE